MGGDRPRTKTIFVRVLRTKFCKGQVGTKAPQEGELEKVPHPKNFESTFLELQFKFFFNFRDQRGPKYLSFSAFKRKSLERIFCKIKKYKKFTLGGLAPKFDP